MPTTVGVQSTGDEFINDGDRSKDGFTGLAGIFPFLRRVAEPNEMAKFRY